MIPTGPNPTPYALPAPDGFRATVAGPLTHWAKVKGGAMALDDGLRRLSFEALDEAVRRRAAEIGTDGPIRWLPDSDSQMARLIDFCAIISTGRAAAVSDPSWPPQLRAAVEAALEQDRRPVPPPGPESAFYLGFTSGSTGMPKGFRRNHRSWTESFLACRRQFGPDADATILAPGRLSHSLFLFAMLLGIWSGGGVHMQDRFSPARCLDLLAAGAAACLVAVPSQILLMLETAERRNQPPLRQLRLILISGARWMRQETPRLKALFPEARIVEFYGASEASFISWTDSHPDLPHTLVGWPFDNVEVAIRTAAGAPCPAGETGLVFVRSPMLFDDYALGDDGSLLRDGDWISVRDMGFLDAQGRLHLVGREKRMIVTQGQNLFPEEVESVLCDHPAIASASVFGMADALRGLKVAAVVAFRPGESADRDALTTHCRERLQLFKVPRLFFVREGWPQTAGGKTDHGRLAAEAMASMGETEGGGPCLRRL